MGKDNQGLSKSPDIESLLSEIFEHEEDDSSAANQNNKYPESLLQRTEKANKLYGSFQRFTKQFIPEGDVTKITRWNNSSIETTQRLVMEQWSHADNDRSPGLIRPPSENGNIENGLRRSKTTSKASGKSLFSWSTGDSYVHARRKELELRRIKAGHGGPAANPNGHKRSMSTPSNSLNPNIKQISKKEEHIRSIKEEAIQDSPLAKRLGLNSSKASVTNALNQVVEKESNTFIHRRIQLIKAHHSEQISKKIHERKRRDHESHLIRLREKEEEYEQALRAALTDRNHVRNSGFFGSLFGFSGMNVSHNHQSRESLHSRSSRPSTEGSESTVTDKPTKGSTSSSKRGKRLSLLPANGFSLWGSPKVDPIQNEKIFDLEDEQTKAASELPSSTDPKPEEFKDESSHEEQESSKSRIDSDHDQEEPESLTDHTSAHESGEHESGEHESGEHESREHESPAKSETMPEIIGLDVLQDLETTRSTSKPQNSSTSTATHEFMNLNNSNALIDQLSGPTQNISSQKNNGGPSPIETVKPNGPGGSTTQLQKKVSSDDLLSF